MMNAGKQQLRENHLYERCTGTTKSEGYLSQNNARGNDE
jgi:hypothetical protein